MKRVIAAFVVLLVAGAVTGWAADAKENWKKNCASCHGEDGKGQTTMGKKLAVKDYTDAKVQEKMTDEHMFKAIKEGQGKMKAYGTKLSDEEIKALVKHVRELKK